MRKCSLFLSILVLFHLTIVVPPASALVVTDVTANKTLLAVYAKMTAVWTKLAAMASVAKDHYDSAVEVEQIISDANQTYQTISNFDLNNIAAEFQSGDALEYAGDFNTLGTIQGAINDKVGVGESNVDFVSFQASRIKNIQRLGKLKYESAKNLVKASTDLKERDSNQITAQSTTTLAMLAALEERRKEQEALEAAKAEKEGQKSESHMGNIYRAMGRQNQ